MDLLLRVGCDRESSALSAARAAGAHGKNAPAAPASLDDIQRALDEHNERRARFYSERARRASQASKLVSFGGSR